MSAYDEYMNLDRELDALIEAGQCESDAADALRDRMDPLWWKLTDEQRRELNKDVILPDVPGQLVS